MDRIRSWRYEFLQKSNEDQFLLHARLLQESVLFLPVLYIAFGLMLDVLIVIAFYSWGMSWEFRKTR